MNLKLLPSGSLPTGKVQAKRPAVTFGDARVVQNPVYDGLPQQSQPKKKPRQKEPAQPETSAEEVVGFGSEGIEEAGNGYLEVSKEEHGKHTDPRQA